MNIFNKGVAILHIVRGKRGQIVLENVNLIRAIIFMVIVVIILFFMKDALSNYLSKFYDCMRYGGCFG